MRVFARRIRGFLAIVIGGLIVGVSIGLSDGIDISTVARYGLQGATAACGLFLLLRFMLLLVSLDPEKPRAARRQNNSAPGSL